MKLPKTTYQFVRFVLFNLFIIQTFSRFIEEDKKFNLHPDSLSSSFSTNYLNEEATNQFRIKLSSLDLLSEKILSIYLESENSDLYLNIWVSPERKKTTESLKIGSYSGNALFIMNESLFDEKLNYVKTGKSLLFSVRSVSNQKDIKKTKYDLKIVISDKVSLPSNKSITTMVDPKLNVFGIDFMYNGQDYPDLSKLRLQLSSIRTYKDWNLSAFVNHNDEKYELNSIFKKSVGGVLDSSIAKLCKDPSCIYSMTVSQHKIHMMEIETFIISSTETISINHYESYYDKTYLNDQITTYILPITKEMENMDISISLVPVHSETNLYINPDILPKKLESYLYSEKGHLAKRITISWKDLVNIKTDKKNIYISVDCPRPGEYLLKTEIHEQGKRGRMHSGVVESGMVQFDEIAEYFYSIEIIESQDISFDVKLNINSGDADLYVKRCSEDEECSISEEETTHDNVFKVENTLNEKDLKKVFKCSHEQGQSSTFCNFSIGIKGKENHGTHYEISLNENKFHRLLLPGHSLSLDLQPNEISYLKFSIPHSDANNTRLFLSIESIWGDFDVYISKKKEFPCLSSNEITESFKENSYNILSTMKNIELLPEKFAKNENSIDGIYYIAIDPSSESFLNLKIFEKKDHEISIHTLSAGKPVKGNISDEKEIIYYSIKVSLEDTKTDSISVNLIPLKGNFIMYANRNEILPTKSNHEFFSENNHLELKIEVNKKTTEEFLIGIESFGNRENNEDLHFSINFGYSTKPLRLVPGVFSSHFMKSKNIFLIKILDKFNDLLILKSIIDGYNIRLCAGFTTTQTDLSEIELCEFSAMEKAVSLYFNKDTLKSKCDSVKKESTNHSPSCFLKISVEGISNQKFKLGYTYNDKPFHLTKGEIMNGPWILDPDARINFIYHPLEKQEIGLYFNSKGGSLSIFSKLVDSSEEFIYPSEDDHNDGQLTKIGYVSNIYYSEEQITGSKEILLSVLPTDSISGEHSDLGYDSQNSFILQTTTGCIEIMRTQALSQSILENEWTYFSFYNNGNSSQFKIFVISQDAVHLELLLSPGLASRPPITNAPLLSKSAIGAIELEVTTSDLSKQAHSSNLNLKGHYIAAVKSKKDTNIHIYWNNKPDLNYLELTPNEPSTMILNPNQKLYFAVYVKDSEGVIKGDSAYIERKDIKLYFKVSVKASVYVLKSNSNELDVPSPSNYIWKEETASKGGIVLITISPKDPGYCVDCLYIGYVESNESGTADILANIKHDNMPIHLKPGFTFPEFINPKDELLMSLFTVDTSVVDLTISILSGDCKVYISRSKDISTKKYDEVFSSKTELKGFLFIQISPQKYQISEFTEWFILIKNSNPNPTSLTISVNKNSIHSHIEPGISKFVKLGPGEQSKYYYKPSSLETRFEARLQLDQLENIKLKHQALELLEQNLSIYQIDTKGESLSLQPSKVNKIENILYVEFEFVSGGENTFVLKAYNPVDCFTFFKLDLVAGYYHLINFNTFNYSMATKSNPDVFEAYGAPSQFVYVDLKVCKGDPKVLFYESESNQIEDKKERDFRTIRSEHSVTHSLMLTKSKIFLKVLAENDSDAIYSLNMYNQKDIEDRGFVELNDFSNNDVKVNLSSSYVQVAPVTVTSTIKEGFIVKVVYIVYLSTNIDQIKFAKNCGKHLIHKAFDNHTDLLKFTSEHTMSKKSKSSIKNIKINLKGLPRSQTFNGIVVASVNLFPKEDGHLTPIRSGRVYYKEFSIRTSQYDIDIEIVIWVVISVMAMLMLMFVCKSVLLSKRTNGKAQLKDIDDETVMAFKAFSLLETNHKQEMEMQ